MAVRSLFLTHACSLFCLCVVVTCSPQRVQADGLNDVEIVEAGYYPVQVAQPSAPLCLSPGLAARLKLPGEATVYPLAKLSNSALSPENCPTHIHRFYHSGRSSYQCPIISGGRTRVVTVHPTTGEPIEFFVMLAAGAPRVEYHRTHFAYVYPDGHSTVVRFPSFNPLQSRVVVSQHAPSRIKQHTQSLFAHLHEQHETIRNSNTVQALHQAHDDAKQLGEGLAVLGDQSLGTMIETTQAISDLLPGKAYVQSLREQQALDARDNQIRRVQQEAKNEGRFIRWPD
ncbi:MAG: hypothetical protein JNL67_03140 [Planctomycetaceae bacterium]|nr:hypothetical protein [Planctomycetaceae bacterium]